ncbi:transposase [Desulfococcaceae bacterium HSG9]|nr:transposase [Desulfococcaceae bacterium HSG9]
MKKSVSTLENQQEQILNYFIERVTNGFVEGMNRAIRIIIRRAFRYRNFKSFRLQVLRRVPDDFVVKFDFIILSPVDYDDKDTARSYGTSYS